MSVKTTLTEVRELSQQLQDEMRHVEGQRAIGGSAEVTTILSLAERVIAACPAVPTESPRTRRFLATVREDAELMREAYTAPAARGVASAETYQRMLYEINGL
ncbi:MAG TPA: hypothetical protein VLJ21_02430 [Candidatus Binatia bacterium]|nr:hypothetical protein [Candidatus Binatia bacterium]